MNIIRERRHREKSWVPYGLLIVGPFEKLDREWERPAAPESLQLPSLIPLGTA